MSKIIKIESVPKYFSITWMLGSFCNYDCMYCSSELHDTTSRPHDLDTMQNVWRNIYAKTHQIGLKYKINFSGGEVTANKNFLPLVEWLRANYADIAVIVITTNGSASANYYSKLAEVVESISFSTHSEFMNEKEFFDKTITINKLMFKLRKSFHVSVMNEYWNKDRIELYKKILDKHKINYTVNEINYLHKIRDFTVNKGQQNLESI